MIDLHTHSLASDGTDTPGELINKAHARGISVLGLMDHDTVAGWDEATSYLRPGMSLVLGSEISCQTSDGTSVHMLGMLFDRENTALAEVLSTTRDNRLTRMNRIIGRLNEAGFEITIEDVLAQLAPGATLGRPHLADALIAKKIVASRDEAFTELLHNNSKYYISHYSPTPEDAIKLIKQAGGVAVIAHPLASLRGRTVSIDSFKSMVEAGLDGIEISHRDQSEDERQLLREVVEQYGIIATGSSDYHGNGKLNELAEFTTTPEDFEALEAKADARRVVRK
ncbi:metal-dependent phosphoesterase [freshwater metagenome]|jgi:predicted metal-dependent phosphoesterase TrpH|uniref:Metal-dependent phosphoesterase n=1 Tax=freshwater metagenome TaxID=449393 RepID=A0A094QGA0_9ZZZZ